jgi:uncharacterized membrane protein YfcA
MFFAFPTARHGIRGYGFGFFSVFCTSGVEEMFDLGTGDILLRLGLGLVIGFCIGLTGIGGGVLGLQATTLALGMEPVRAVGTTSLYIVLTNATACFHHAKLKNIAWGVVGRILAGAVPANILVAMWVSRQGKNTAFQHDLKAFIIAVVFFAIGVMAVNSIKKVADEEQSLAKRIRGHWLMRNVLGVLLGAVIGGLIGATAIGGGILVVPLMLIVYGLSASQTVGSTITAALALGLSTSVVYGRGGELDYPSAIVMAGGSLAGVRFGSRLAVKMPDTLLRWIMIGLILVAALMMLPGLLK